MIVPLCGNESLSEHLSVKLPIMGDWIVGGLDVKLKSEPGNIMLSRKMPKKSEENYHEQKN